jgi:CheY-like chemotaxis protein
VFDPHQLLASDYPGGLPGSLRRLTVLVVEDDAALRAFMTKQLAASGALVLATASAEDAEAALEAARGVHAVHLPGRDGVTLVRALRRLRAAMGAALPRA